MELVDWVGLASCLHNDGWLGLVGLPYLQGWLGWGDMATIIFLVLCISSLAWCFLWWSLHLRGRFDMVSLYNTLDYTISSLDHGWVFGRRAVKVFSIG